VVIVVLEYVSVVIVGVAMVALEYVQVVETGGGTVGVVLQIGGMGTSLVVELVQLVVDSVVLSSVVVQLVEIVVVVDSVQLVLSKGQGMEMVQLVGGHPHRASKTC